MIHVRVVLDSEGGLSGVWVSGHASIGAGGAGENLVCAAVTAIVRACGDAIAARRTLQVSAGASGPGDLTMRITGVPAEERGWLRGVTDVMLQGVGRVASDSPGEVQLEVRTGESHGT